VSLTRDHLGGRIVNDRADAPTSPELPAARAAGADEAEGSTDLAEVIDTLADRSKELLQLVGGVMGEQRLRRAGEGRFRLWMAIVTGVFLLVIVGTVAGLTYAGKVDGSSFTFLLGVVVGAMLALMRDMIMPPRSGA
jgi:hypothetical protein